jgi:hypothetical protein
MALYLCREILGHLEKLNAEKEEGVPGRNASVQDLEGHLYGTLDQIISDLKGLELSIEARDPESMLVYEDSIDSLVDYLDHLIDATERNQVTGLRGYRTSELKTWRESTGKLAQLLCQLD